MAWIAPLVACLGTAPATPEPSTPEPSTPEPSTPEPAVAKAEERVQAAQRHYEAGRYDEASRALAQAYASDPNPDYLYARAQAERQGGHCDRAVPLYQQFLETSPPAIQAEAARTNLSRCDALLSAGEPLSAGAVPSPPMEVDQPAPRKVSVMRDPWGGALLATGAAGLAVGFGFLGQSFVDQGRAEDAPTEGDYADWAARAQSYRRLGVGGIAVGGALLVGAAVRYGVLASRNRRSKVAIVPTWNGVMLTGRF